MRGIGMTTEQNAKYRNILIDPVNECAKYSPKFGHGRAGGFSLSEFQALYGADTFYNWLGLNNPLVYSAHKAAGGITSLYRQIGIGCERLVRAVFMDYLGLGAEDVSWSYEIAAANGKPRKLSLDGRIVLSKIADVETRKRCAEWVMSVADGLNLAPSIRGALTGVVFEIRQGYKSKDSKRQNADIANAANAYANGYIPCLMVLSAQIDDDIVSRYDLAKWAILQGVVEASSCSSTFHFFNQVIGFDFVGFMDENQDYFRSKISYVLEQLMKAE